MSKKNVKFGKSGNRKEQCLGKVPRIIVGSPGKLCIRLTVPQKEVDFYMLVEDTVRTSTCLKLQRGQSKFAAILLVSKKDKKVPWKSHHQKLLNIGFVWDKETLTEAGTASGVLYLKENDIVKDSISKIKNGKTTGLKGLVLEMVKLADEAGEGKLLETEVNRLLMIWYWLVSHLMVGMGGLKANVENAKIMINSEEARKVKRKVSFFVPYSEKVQAVVLSTANFASIKCIRDAMTEVA